MPAHRRRSRPSPSSRSRRPAGRSARPSRNSPLIATVSSTPFTEMTTLLTGPLGDDETTPGAEPGVRRERARRTRRRTGMTGSQPPCPDRPAVRTGRCSRTGRRRRVVRRPPAAALVRVQAALVAATGVPTAEPGVGSTLGSVPAATGAVAGGCGGASEFSIFIVFGTWIARIPTKNGAARRHDLLALRLRLEVDLLGHQGVAPPRIRTRPEPVSQVSASSSCPSCRSWSRSCRSTLVAGGVDVAGGAVGAPAVGPLPYR